MSRLRPPGPLALQAPSQIQVHTDPPHSAFLAGGIAACGAVTLTHPFETVKIRMQLQGELRSSLSRSQLLYKGPFHGIAQIARLESPLALFRGLTCAYAYQLLLNGCRLGFYEPLRRMGNTLVFGGGSEGLQSAGVNVACGAGSGMLGAAAGSPFFLVKTRLQSFSAALPVGTQHEYRSARDGFGRIWAQEGVVGLYRGVGAAMVRTGFGSAVQLPTYFFAKRRLLKIEGVEEGLPLHLASSAASGLVVCCVMHPPDTIMSRMYNQTGNLYRGVFDCLWKTVRTEGPLAIYKGFNAHLARILPHTVGGCSSRCVLWAKG